RWRRRRRAAAGRRCVPPPRGGVASGRWQAVRYSWSQALRLSLSGNTFPATALLVPRSERICRPRSPSPPTSPPRPPPYPGRGRKTLLAPPPRFGEGAGGRGCSFTRLHHHVPQILRLPRAEFAEGQPAPAVRQAELVTGQQGPDAE